MTIRTPIFVAMLCGAAIFGAAVVAACHVPFWQDERKDAAARTDSLGALLEDQAALRRQVDDLKRTKTDAMLSVKTSAVEESAARLRALRDALAETRESPSRQVQALSQALADSHQDFARWQDSCMARLQTLQTALREKESQNLELTREVETLRAQLQRQADHSAP